MSDKDKSDNNKFGGDSGIDADNYRFEHDQINELNDAIKATPEYKVGKNLMEEYAEKNHSLDGNPDRLPNEDPEDHNKISIREINKEIADDYKGEPTTADEYNKELLDDGIHMHNKNRAEKFLNSLRGHLIISQALTYGISHLRTLENRKNKYPKNREHAQPSNRSDMEYLKEHLFPLYDLFNAA